MRWIWTALNTPKLQMTVVQELGISAALVACVALLVLGAGCVYYAISRR